MTAQSEPFVVVCSFASVVQISEIYVINLCIVCAHTHAGWLRTLNSLVGRNGASVCWLVCRRCSQVCTEIAPQYAGWHPDGLANLSQKWSHKSSHSMRIGISADAVICTEIAPQYAGWHCKWQVEKLFLCFSLSSWPLLAAVFPQNEAINPTIVCGLVFRLMQSSAPRSRHSMQVGIAIGTPGRSGPLPAAPGRSAINSSLIY